MLAINSRAKLPTDQQTISREFKISYRTILSVNPKTEKSVIQTYILHLAPADTSGLNICPGAGNCKAICLHFAGNPVYMSAKQSARIRRTLAYIADPQRFMRLLVCAILDKLNKHVDEALAFRLNGTSDVAWENIDFSVTPEFAQFCRIKFGRMIPLGTRNIFEIFNWMRCNTGEDVTFYDYTKVKHNWAECRRLGYHLTFSFDGWENRSNIAIARDALHNGIKVAAAFNVKRNQPLPSVVFAGKLISQFDDGMPLIVYDGDKSDFRPSDPSDCSIIGLRFKLPHGIAYTPAQKMAFCIA